MADSRTTRRMNCAGRELSHIRGRQAYSDKKIHENPAVQALYDEYLGAAGKIPSFCIHIIPTKEKTVHNPPQKQSVRLTAPSCHRYVKDRLTFIYGISLSSFLFWLYIVSLNSSMCIIDEFDSMI